MSSFEPERRRDGERIQRAVGVANKLLENIDLVVRGKQEDQARPDGPGLPGTCPPGRRPGDGEDGSRRALAQSIDGATPSRIQCRPTSSPRT